MLACATFKFENLAKDFTYHVNRRLWIPELQKKGYHFHLIFLWLKDVELAVFRVKERVKFGGHSVPDETIRRRYTAGLKNFFSYIAH
jgi:Uncharacterized protein conserved in bacteria